MMTRILIILFVSLMVIEESYTQTIQPGLNLLDFDWRFHRGGVPGADSANFDDSSWRQIDLPHDWSIENLPGKDTPFNPRAISQVSGGFTEGGTGWYRKMFRVAENNESRIFHLQFDGVYMNTEVWLNGQYVGNHQAKRPDQRRADQH